MIHEIIFGQTLGGIVVKVINRKVVIQDDKIVKYDEITNLMVNAFEEGILTLENSPPEQVNKALAAIKEFQANYSAGLITGGQLETEVRELWEVIGLFDYQLYFIYREDLNEAINYDLNAATGYMLDHNNSIYPNQRRICRAMSISYTSTIDVSIGGSILNFFIMGSVNVSKTTYSILKIDQEIEEFQGLKSVGAADYYDASRLIIPLSYLNYYPLIVLEHAILQA